MQAVGAGYVAPDVPDTVRKDSIHAQVHGGILVHPRVADAFRKLENRQTGTLVDWAFLDKNFVSVKGDIFRYTSAYRSAAEQAKLYAAGRTEPGGIVTKAPEYRSFHNWGLAVDFVFTRYGYDTFTIEGVKYDFSKPAVYLKTGIPQFLESCGLTWGGRWTEFPDIPHFEYRAMVPVDDAFCGAPWWGMGADTVRITQRPVGGLGQAWVVVASLAAGFWLLRKRG